MTESIHPAASHHMPSFITAPGEIDELMIVVGIILILFVQLVGILYFRLHALPECFAHNKVQFEIVCMLDLIAMFTHNNIFWIAGLLLALIEFPAFSTPLQRIAGSTEKIAAQKSGEEADKMTPRTMTAPGQADRAGVATAMMRRLSSLEAKPAIKDGDRQLDQMQKQMDQMMCD